MVTWTTPAYTEINMSAEIGGYQDDFEERGSKPEAWLSLEPQQLGPKVPNAGAARESCGEVEIGQEVQ